jgi:hypothetical protein
MNKEALEIYTDFLLAHTGAATATALSRVSGGERSHDQITRFLSGQDYTSKQLWMLVKPAVRRVEGDEGCLIFDDTIQPKEWTDENEVICWHFDHVQNKAVKGINLLNALYYNQDTTLPVAFEIIKKPEVFYDQAEGKGKRRATVTKNEQVRAMIQTCINNQLRFRYILMDSWFCAKENLGFIVGKKKHFIAAMKGNRLVALNREDKKQGRFQAISTLALPDQQAVRGWLKGFEHEVLLVRRVFINKDGTRGELNLVCSDLGLEGVQVAAIYQKRWKAEEFHKSLKSNAGLGASPTRRERTQCNHVFMSIYTVFKMECLKIKYHINHFALKNWLRINASTHAFNLLRSEVGA